MAFTVQDFRDLVQLLEQHPEWRAELRRWVLSEEVLTLPQTVRELADAQRRTEEQLERLTARVDTLAEQLERLTARVDTLAEQLEQLTIRVSGLTEQLERLTARVDTLAEVQLRMATDLEQLKGSDLERRYRERGHAYFSRLLRRAHVLSGDELNTLLQEAITLQQLTEDEADDIIQADVIVRGRRREDSTEVYLVVEVSWGVGPSDVQRASQRALLLARSGAPVLPVVAGTWVTPEAQTAARSLRVWQVTDGRVTPPEAA